jgi:hypothetical protein
MRRLLVWAVDLAFMLNGALMLVLPELWYGLIPGVADTGPLNEHFVRDVGCAYLVAGSSLLWFSFDRRARPAALAGAAFLALHALVHIWDWVGGRESSVQLLIDAPTVLVPGLFVFKIARPVWPFARRRLMIKWLLRRRLAAFERSFGYDVSYVREILEASPRAVMALGRIQALARYRRDVPKEVYFAAKLMAARAEDCGPCTQLVVTMAERAGVSGDVLRAVLARDERAMSDDVALGFRFTEAVLAHDTAADALREEIVRRWGQRAVLSLAFAIAASRVYPTIKYALGHGKACTRITVGGTPLPVLRQAA